MNLDKEDIKKYMQLAIDEMKKSVQEPRVDGKISPKVGAVLVKPNGEIVKAHRGELRDGDHSEFTLLERKCRSENLTGSILFVTLEPCAPGARKEPKLSCAERIVIARIADVYIGIEDPDPTVANQGLDYLQKNNISTHIFNKELQKTIEEVNREFLRQARERANATENDSSGNDILQAFDNTVHNSSITRFSRDALFTYIEKAELKCEIDSKELEQHLEDIGILKWDKISNVDILTPTGVGLLLFAQRPRDFFQQSVIKAKVKYGRNDEESQDFDQPIVLVPFEIEKWLKKVLHSTISRDEFERKVNTDYPIEPLREAIINAIAHRDYTIDGAKVYIEIDDDKIVIKSPGLPKEPITLEDVQTFNAPSLSRNPKISYVFSRMKLMEENRLGMDTFKYLPQKYNLPLPIYSYQAPYLCLTFPRGIVSSKILSVDYVKDLNSDELRGWHFVKQKGSVSKKEYADEFGFDEKKAQRHLEKFRKNGLVIVVGKARATKYIIKN